MQCLPALRFAPGTTYAEALRALVRSVMRDGTLPTGATLVPHLPRGADWAPRGRSGPRLDLTAPASYSVPGGLVLTPTFTLPASVGASDAERIAKKRLRDGRPLGEDADKLTIDVPALRACQRLPRSRRLPPAAAPHPPLVDGEPRTAGPPG